MENGKWQMENVKTCGHPSLTTDNASRASYNRLVMPLPILHVTHEPSPQDLVRYFHRAQLHWSRHLGEEVASDVGSIITNRQLPRVIDANVVLDAIVPDGRSTEQAIELVDAQFREQASRCLRWVPAPTAPAAQTEPLVEALLARGFVRRSFEIHYLYRQPTGVIEEVGGLTIIPARASFRHARELAEQWARQYALPELADAAMLHLDDPHTDALIALKDGTAAANVSVLSVGEIGLIEDLFVAEPFRRQGIGRTMLSRAMEICARSLFKHIFLGADGSNRAACALYVQFGFKKIGEFVSYDAPDAGR